MANCQFLAASEKLPEAKLRAKFLLRKFPDIHRDPDLFNNIIGTINCLWEGLPAPIIAAGSCSHSCEAKF